MNSNFSTLKVTLSVIAISLCILTSSLSFISESNKSNLNMDTAGSYRMMDDNNPEKPS